MAKKDKPKAPVAPAAKKSTRPTPSGGQTSRSDVERRWQEYWRCRTELEQACNAVRQAQTSLGAAVDKEKKCRSVFEESKKVLKDLLEVESPASSSDLLSSRPSNIVEFDKAD